MKNCRDYEDWISAFLDGELSEPEQAELMAHMAACRDCQQYFDDLVAIHEAAMEFEESPVPEGFAEQIMDRVRAAEQDKPETTKRIRLPQWRRWAALAACCVFALFGAWCFRNMRGVNFAADQEMMAADDMPQMVRAAEEPGAMDDSENGVMVMMDEDVPADDSMSRMASGVFVRDNMYGAEEDDDVEAEADMEEYLTEAVKDVPVPSPMAPTAEASGGTLIAGGDIVRQWVEDELGLDWESGQVYALTAEQYAWLAGFLTEAGVEFRTEAGDAFWLKAE